MTSFSPGIPARSDFDLCWHLRKEGPAGDVVERVLHDVGVMNPDGWADWGPSAWTATGAPVEMLFYEGQSDLALTTEIGDPLADPSHRVAEVCEIMKQLGSDVPPAALRQILSFAQGAGHLRSGARLGLTYGADGLYCRLHAELPATASDLAGLLWPTDVAMVKEILDLKAKPTEYVFDGQSRQHTLHFDIRRPCARLFTILARLAGVTARALTESIDRMRGAAAARLSPIQNFGFSLRTQSGGRPPIVTLYVQASDLFGNDEEIFLALRPQARHRLPGYESFADCQQAALDGGTHHGKIGLTFDANGPAKLSIAVAASWDCCLNTA